MLFWERFYNMCAAKGCKPNTIVKSIGLSTATATKWKNGAIPNGEALTKIADYLDCSIDYLLGRTEKPSSTVKNIEGNETGSAVVQSSHNGSVTVTSSANVLTEEETELLRLFQSLDVKRRVKMLNFCYSLEEEATIG